MICFKKQSGFSLAEVLVTLLVFTLGALGIEMYTATGVKTASANQIRSQSLKASSQLTEPLIYNSRHDCLSAAITSMYPRTITADNGKDTLTINFVSAVDGRGVTVATANANGSANIAVASNLWSSPITITLQAPFQGLVGTTYSYPTYSIILQNYTTACDI